MAESLQNQALFKKLHIALLFFVIFVAKSSYAQSLLLPGDIVFVTVNANSNSFEFIPLIDLEKGTEFKISNGEWNNDAQNFSEGQFVTFVARNRVKAGTPIKYTKNDPSDFDFKGSMELSDEMETLFIYQEEVDVHRFIFGIGWGAKKGRRDRSFFGSDVPNIFKENPKALLSLGTENNYQYFIRNGASGTSKMLLDFVTNASYWRGNEKIAFNNIGTSFNLLTPPVILFDESLTSISENDKKLSLNVAIYEHDGSKLTVDVIFDSTYSSIERSEIKGFRKKQINFTGLIGNAVYEIELPLEDDKRYEGIETGIFNLNNLSKGRFGDFISHTTLFIDDEIPELKLELSDRFDEKILLIHNLESIEVDLGNWELAKGDLKLNIAKNTSLGVGESLIVMKENDLLSEAIARSSYFLDEEQFEILSTQGTIQLKDVQGRKIVSLEILNSEGRSSTLLSESVNTSNVETQTRNTDIDLSSTASKVAIPGWKAVTGKDISRINFSSTYLYTWDENKAEFLKVGRDINSISDNRLVVGYFDQNESEKLLDEKAKAGINETLSFTISATDSDENGRIDGTEGLNLIQNNTSQIFSVSSLIQSMKNKAQLNDNILAFRSSPDFSSISLLEDDAVVLSEQLIWIRLDSEQEVIELELNTQEFLPSETITEEIEKGSLELEVVGNSTRSSFKVNFVPEEIQPENKRNFKFSNSLYLNNLKEIVLTGSIFGDHFDVFEINNLSENITQLPLNFAANKSGEFELRINNWTDIPDGWVIKIEDLKDEKSYELDENWSLKFNYSDLRDPESIDDHIPSIEERFVLKVIPEGLLVEDEKDELPISVELHQNYPNPFNPSTTISFYMPEEGTVKLSVFNIVGQPVAVLLQETKSQGEHTQEWDASDMPSGIYIYQLEVGTKIMTRKMTLVK